MNDETKRPEWLKVCVMCEREIDPDEECIFFRAGDLLEATAVSHEDCADEAARGTLRSGPAHWWPTGKSAIENPEAEQHLIEIHEVIEEELRNALRRDMS